MRGIRNKDTIKIGPRHSSLVSDSLAVEAPLEVQIWDHQNKLYFPLNVTMRTPGSDVELALGFLFAEGIIGKMEDKNAYIAALKEVAKVYKGTDEAKKATEMLSFLQKDMAIKDPSKKTSSFQANPNEKHYLLVVGDQFSNKIAKVSNNLSDFNKTNFSVDNIKVQQMRLRIDPKPLLLIKTFKDATKAMTYYSTLKKQETAIFSGLDVSYKLFVISQSNFSKMFKDESIDQYEAFFKKNYR